MRIVRLLSAAVLFFCFFVGTPALAQSTPQPESVAYIKAKVVEVVATGTEKIEGIDSPWQTVKVELLDGREEGKTVQIDYGKDTLLSEDALLKKGEQVLLTDMNAATEDPSGTPEYVVVLKNRIGGIIWAFIIFLVLTVIFAGKKGIGAIIGLGFSILVLVYFMIPLILNGWNPMLIGLVGALIIMVVSLVLSHGFSKRTMVALVSILITVGVGAILAQLFVAMTKLTGRGSEDALFLTQVGSQAINLKGLLLAGIMVGMLGVLDDVATTQAAAIHELKAADNRFRFKDLFERGLKIGKEHIASLVNTLALAYVGASFPLLLLFASAEKPSLLFALNSESLVEEIVRTLVGSSALVLAVPITTFVAAYVYGKMTHVEHDATIPEHHH